MAKAASQSKEVQITNLEKQVAKLRAELSKLGSAQRSAKPIDVRLQKSQERFKRIRNADGPDTGVGEFFLIVDVTAVNEAVFIPLSIASGKKPTGFLYQIEGTGQGSISTTDITAKGDGVTQVMLGTIRYAKIPKGETASFRILIEIKGSVEKTYKIVVTRINYKFNPSDARYQRFDKELASGNLKFH